MGQQQLLLIVLITIVVGIASLVAITTFDSAAKAANRDALTMDITTLASSAQDYFLRSESLGGGRTFDGFTIQGKLLPLSGISEDGLFAQTENGTLEVSSVSGNTFTIIGHPSSCEGYQPGTVDVDGILATPGNCSEANQISATVGGREIVFE